MALRLCQHLNSVLAVWNRTENKSHPLRAAGALVSPSLRFLCESSDTVCLMLTGDEATKAAVAEALGCAAPPTLLVNFATVSPECARDCAEQCAVRGCAYASCPVTGRPDRAASGQLACWVSATEASAARTVAEELCPALAGHVAVLSETDASVASTFKLVSNFLIYGGAELLAEATALAEAAGLQRDAIAQFLSVVGPWNFLQGYADRINQRDYSSGGAGMDVALKDLALCRQLARGAALPTLEAAYEHCTAVAATASAGRDDWCSLADEVERRARAQIDGGRVRPREGVAKETEKKQRTGDLFMNKPAVVRSGRPTPVQGDK